MSGSRITSMSGLRPSHTKPTPQMGAKRAARGTLRRMIWARPMPHTSKSPPIRLAQQAAAKASHAKSSGDRSSETGFPLNLNST